MNRQSTPTKKEKEAGYLRTTIFVDKKWHAEYTKFVKSLVPRMSFTKFLIVGAIDLRRKMTKNNKQN